MLRDKKRIAIQLRLEGKSYNEIRGSVKVAKSTLAGWLKDYKLSGEQTEALGKRYKAQQIERYRETVRLKKEVRLAKVYEELEHELLPLSERESLIAGLFLYLGEGSKVGPSTVRICNTDPNIVKFVVNWYIKVLHIVKAEIKVDLQLYHDMDIGKIMDFWSTWLDLPLTQFRKPYIKHSTTRALDHSGFKFGTCGINYGSARLKEKIMLSMKVILDSISLTERV